VQVDSAKVKDDASKYRPFMVDFLLPESDRDHVRFNVPVIYMARDEMILMGANQFRGPLGPSNDPSNGFVPIKIIKSKGHIKNR
jgi:hypothetical protein